MYIDHIKISNFRSFDELDLKLGFFNIVIGPNASGKSNFISVFRFLKDIASHGLDDAISMQEGGIDFLQSINNRFVKNTKIEISLNSKDEDRVFINTTEGTAFGISFDKIHYFLEINVFKTKTGKIDCKVICEKIYGDCKTYKAETKNEKLGKPKLFESGRICLINNNGKISSKVENLHIKDEFLIQSFLYKKKLAPKRLLLEQFSIIVFLISSYFKSLSVYNFNPQLSKESTFATGKTDLKYNGSNLAFVLKKIVENKKREEKMLKLFKDILPFIERIEVEKLADGKSILANLKETYSKNASFPASLISDGTIIVTSILITLFFENKPLIIYEEPERSVHPALLSKITNMMKDVAERRKRQILITTHNPLFVKYGGLENLLYVKRHMDGFSTISRISEKNELKDFIETMGVEELFIQDLLE